MIQEFLFLRGDSKIKNFLKSTTFKGKAVKYLGGNFNPVKIRDSLIEIPKRVRNELCLKTNFPRGKPRGIHEIKKGRIFKIRPWRLEFVKYKVTRFSLDLRERHTSNPLLEYRKHYKMHRHFVAEGRRDRFPESGDRF